MVGALLFGCTAVKLDHPPSIDEYAGKLKSGTATITGEAFATTRGGDVKYASGRVVHLDKVTSYSTELLQKLRHHGTFSVEKEQDTVEIDPQMLSQRRNMLANSVGRFRFANLAAGEYYVSCYISWMVRDGSWSGGWAILKVKVQDGETKNVILR